MSDSSTSHAQPESLLQDIITLVEDVSTRIEEALVLRRRCLEDHEYLEKFRAEFAKTIAKRSVELAAAPVYEGELSEFWPEGFDRNRLSDGDIEVGLQFFRRDIRLYAEEGSPREIIFDAIGEALGDYEDSFFPVSRIDTLLAGPDTFLLLVSRAMQELASVKGLHRGRLVDIVRMTYSSEESLTRILTAHQRCADKLVRYCKQAIELLEMVNRLRVDHETFSVHYKGKGVALGNRKPFLLIAELSRSVNTFVPFGKLAVRIGGHEDDKIWIVKHRLDKTLRAEGLSELADCIQTEDGHCGLFLSDQARKPKVSQK